MSNFWASHDQGQLKPRREEVREAHWFLPRRNPRQLFQERLEIGFLCNGVLSLGGFWDPLPQPGAYIYIYMHMHKCIHIPMCLYAYAHNHA